jgi:hypothetical protein
MFEGKFRFVIETVKVTGVSPVFLRFKTMLGVMGGGGMLAPLSSQSGTLIVEGTTVPSSFSTEN